MAEWLVKNLSQLTGVSVQTLHHYDRIDLLKPSLRLANGYRVYTEKDLLKLQQIIALKFFGFELSHIKELVEDEGDALQHFATQAQVLEKKAHALLEGAKALRNITSAMNKSQAIPWKTLIELIEVYQMTVKLEHSWVKDIFTPEELREYAAFKKETDESKQRALFEKKLSYLIHEVGRNLHCDPSSEIGIHLGEECMKNINQLYGKKYAHLRTKQFEKGFANGLGLKERGLTSEIVNWMQKSISAYWQATFYELIKTFGEIPDNEFLSRWNELIDERCGNNFEHKQRVYEQLLNDDKVPDEIKNWLNHLMTNNNNIGG
ncbi:MerR family transcriptional regulator [Legionella quinlivanii]|uniref:MerR family transcriptional regulator n=1 Tax=Legionella quinlivanii TaxID=45073 RepID=A0A0W0Y602_9GAMM|nr:MerR family transcriptional regulator [Legionella quinlivanii]KTD52143.1 MerR family transcriptional regulator [Legionella quinlivanii]SEF77491.1 DNA-binding transcriptional regulator, MerR family [Legionella quinlivanii DSM 21216]STY12358.1 MerR family transcriptional regulator [Legionella quinlivanii]